MDSPAPPTVLELRRGQLLVQAWPPDLRVPFGLRAEAGTLRGPPWQRRRLLQALAAAGLPFVDRAAAPALAAPDLPRPPQPDPPALLAWDAHGGRGIAVGMAESERADLLLGAIHRRRAAASLVVRDSGAAMTWQAALRNRAGPPAAVVLTLAEAAATMHWRSGRFELLAVDRPEQLPQRTLWSCLDACAASCQLGFADDDRHPGFLELSGRLGPVLAIASPGEARWIELRLPLTPDERLEYDRAFDRFLAAFDAFAALRSGSGFRAFVEQARQDPAQRDAVLAWHRATRIAASSAGKTRAVAELLAAHRDERVLVFTADRDGAYAISKAQLIAAGTAELRRSERDAILADFRAGRLRALVGPRLLDLGVPEASADVGILVGGGFGEAQRRARGRRVRPGGTVYELLAEDTLEVGRARRSARTATATPGADRPCG
jgi:hypothetical protein